MVEPALLYTLHYIKIHDNNRNTAPLCFTLSVTDHLPFMDDASSPSRSGFLFLNKSRLIKSKSIQRV